MRGRLVEYRGHAGKELHENGHGNLVHGDRHGMRVLCWGAKRNGNLAIVGGTVIAHGTIYFRSNFGSVQASPSYFSRAACIRSVACQARSTVSRKVHTSSYKSVIF